MHPIKHFSLLFLCLLMSILISACGSRGDLYQVQEPEKVQKATAEESQQASEKPKKKQP